MSLCFFLQSTWLRLKLFSRKNKCYRDRSSLGSKGESTPLLAVLFSLDQVPIPAQALSCQGHITIWWLFLEQHTVLSWCPFTRGCDSGFLLALLLCLFQSQFMVFIVQSLKPCFKKQNETNKKKPNSPNQALTIKLTTVRMSFP